MNASKAKAIRKAIYGERSIRDAKHITLNNGQTIADDLRRAYQYAKKGLDLRIDKVRYA